MDQPPALPHDTNGDDRADSREDSKHALQKAEKPEGQNGQCEPEVGECAHPQRRQLRPPYDCHNDRRENSEYATESERPER